MLQKLASGKFYLDYGPVQMTISAFAGSHPMDDPIRQVEAYVHNLLKGLTSCLDLAKQPLIGQHELEELPAILTDMMRAVRQTADTELTPMAAVAGAFADAVVSFLAGKGATRVIVNNGGDIALRMAPEECIVVGLKSDLQGQGCNYTFRVDGKRNCCGIATSGLGGRGLTKGIASAVTVLAGSSSVADACATSIASQTAVADPAVKMLPAVLLDPQSDLGEQLVTVQCPPLAPASYRTALAAGCERARQLIQDGVILGVAIFTGPYMSVLPEAFDIKINAKNKDLPIGVGT